MSRLDADTVQAVALAFHAYPITAERAASLAKEINNYLATLERLRDDVKFDDAPADFEFILMEYSDA